MYALIIHDDAKVDLRELAARDKHNVARLAFFLRELAGDADLLDRLLQEGYQGEHLDVDAVSCLRAENIWRFKVRALDIFMGRPDDREDSTRWLPHRVLYAPDHRNRRFYVLGVLKRNRDTYEQTDPRMAKLLETHRRLGLQGFGHRH